MENKLLHVFRNTPLGREVLLQSMYFCKTFNITPKIYIPKFEKFLMYFENNIVQVDLDSSYLREPQTAREHVIEIVSSQGLPTPNFIEPKLFTASTLPDIPVDFDFMCCPRSISDLSSKIGLGYIGPKVRNIVQSANFPVLIASSVFKEWNSIAVFFDGSANALKALRLGLRLSRLSGFAMDVFTFVGKKPIDYYQEIIRKENIEAEMDKYVRTWMIEGEGNLTMNLYAVPHNSLVIIGGYGHGVIKEMFFGSIIEKMQAILPNNLLIVGSEYGSPTWH